MKKQQSNNNRYAIISQDISLSKDRLTAKGFTYLPNNNSDTKPKLIVDTHNLKFWPANDNDIENARDIAMERDRQYIEEITIDNLLTQIGE